MAKRDLRFYPDPILRQKTSPVISFDDSLRRLIDDMVETMHAAPGVGLAANQIGESLQLAVIDLSMQKEKKQNHPLLVLVNPAFLSQEGSIIEEEGCLSIPDYEEKVKRAARVKVRAQDQDGKTFEIEAEGFLAKALQHEIDHLNGILYIDRLSSLKKNFFRRRYKKHVKAE
ncbi:MAG: peptide deformylase [Nitrospirota bacterium]